MHVLAICNKIGGENFPTKPSIIAWFSLSDKTVDLHGKIDSISPKYVLPGEVENSPPPTIWLLAEYHPYACSWQPGCSMIDTVLWISKKSLTVHWKISVRVSWFTHFLLKADRNSEYSQKYSYNSRQWRFECPQLLTNRCKSGTWGFKAESRCPKRNRFQGN